MNKPREEFEYMLFDLDGTLTDPREGITKSVQYALYNLGIKEPDLKVLEPFIGPPLKDSFIEFYQLDEEKTKTAIEKYRERFQATGIYENKIYPGIEILLKRLQADGKHLAVASSKPEVYVKKILKYFHIDSYFEVIVGSELDGKRDKKEEVIEEALRRLFKGESPQKANVVMIGDRKFDIEGGKAYGLKTIGVSYGYALEGELEQAGADYMVASVLDLEKLLFGRKKATMFLTENSFQKTLYILKPLIFYYITNQVSYLMLAICLQFSMRILGTGYSNWLNQNAVSVNVGIKCVTMLVGVASVWKMLELKKDRGTGNKWKMSSLFLIILAISSSVSLNILAELSGFWKISERYQEVALNQYAVPFIGGIILYGFVAPLAEEIVFRALILQRLKKHFPTGLSIVCSAFIFGAYHGNVVQGLYAFIIGILLAYMYELYNRFWAPFVFHSVANLAVFFLTYYTNIGAIIVTPINCFILIILSFISLMFIIRIQKNY